MNEEDFNQGFDQSEGKKNAKAKKKNKSGGFSING